VFFAGAAFAENSVVGTWKVNLQGSEVITIMRSDGTFTSQVGDVTVDGFYSVTAGNILTEYVPGVSIGVSEFVLSENEWTTVKYIYAEMGGNNVTAVMQSLLPITATRD